VLGCGVSGPLMGSAVEALKKACQEAAEESVSVAKGAKDGRRVVGGNRKYGSRKEARVAKIAAAKARRAAKEEEEKQKALGKS